MKPEQLEIAQLKLPVADLTLEKQLLKDVPQDTCKP
jgi:hypothetical protein